MPEFELGTSILHRLRTWSIFKWPASGPGPSFEWSQWPVSVARLSGAGLVGRKPALPTDPAVHGPDPAFDLAAPQHTPPSIDVDLPARRDGYSTCRQRAATADASGWPAARRRRSANGRPRAGRDTFDPPIKSV